MRLVISLLLLSRFVSLLMYLLIIPRQFLCCSFLFVCILVNGVVPCHYLFLICSSFGLGKVCFVIVAFPG